MGGAGVRNFNDTRVASSRFPAKVMMPLVIIWILSSAEAGTAATGSIQGTVTSAEGKTVPRATVSAYVFPLEYFNQDYQFMIKPAATATTDAQGAYVLNGLLPFGYRLVVRAKGFQPAVLTGAVIEASDSLTGVDAKLTPGSSVRIRTIDTQGNPVPGTPVFISGKMWGTFGYHLTESYRTDAMGILEYDFDPRMSVSLSVMSDDYIVHSFHRVDPFRDIEIVLEKGPSIRGRVMDAEGAPISGADVLAQCAGRDANDKTYTETVRKGQTGKDGMFTLTLTQA